MQINEGPTDVFVCVVQDTYGQPTEDDERDYLRFKRELGIEFDRSFQEVDVAPGYSLPAFLADLNEMVAPHAAAIALLAIGGNIIQHVSAYIGLAKKIRKFFVREEVLVNRNGATILAIEAVLEECGGTPNELIFDRYYSHDWRMGEHPENLADIQGVGDSVPTEYLSVTVHFVTIVADGVRYECTVKGKDVRLRRLN